MTGLTGIVKRAARGAGRVTMLVCSLAVFCLAGCGAPSVEDVCKRLDEQICSAWSGVDECKDDGERIQDRVDKEGGCDGAFDDYRQCLWDAADCDWQSACDQEIAALEGCIGPL